METTNEDNFDTASLALQQHDFNLEVPTSISREPSRISSITLPQEKELITIMDPAIKKSSENMFSLWPRKINNGAYSVPSLADSKPSSSLSLEYSA